MFHPLVGPVIVTYIIMVYISAYLMFSVGNPLRRCIYLLMLFIMMLVGSILVRLYLFTPMGFVIDESVNGSSRIVLVREVYEDVPYAPHVSFLLTGLSLIPVVFSIVSALELMGLWRWGR